MPFGRVPDPLRAAVARLAYFVRWLALGAIVGVLSGIAAYLFLEALKWATRTRLEHGWLLFLLPLAGFAMGWCFFRFAGDAAGGSALIIDEIHEPRAWIPRRTAPLVFVASVATHLFGGSAGREGVVVQMAGSINDALARALRLGAHDRRLVLIAALAGGFGAAFGAPVAGAVFALEVQSIGRMRYDALVPAFTASIVGDRLVNALGLHENVYPALPHVHLTALLFGKVLVAGMLCGLVGSAFAWLTHRVRHDLARFVAYPPLRLFVGGLAIIALTGLAGTRAYLGISTSLVALSLAGGAGVAVFAFAWKLLFTSVTLGGGFQGGEVTPLFVMGATLGATLGDWMHVSVPLMAALCFVAVFAGAANTPLTCTVLGLEFFGTAAAPLFAVVCVASYMTSSERGIYHSQRVETPKGPPAPAPE